jgi:hypothetical protein
MSWALRRIKYNDASQSLRFEFPDHWQTPTTCNITITDRGGTDLLASTAATIYTATTTDGAVAAGDSTFTIDGSVVMNAGDRFRIQKAGDTPEIVTVQSYASKVATINHTFDFAHVDGSAVFGMWCTYDLDTSTVATWPSGKEVTITWTPSTDNIPFTEQAKVYKLSGGGSTGWRDHFRARYPNLYRESSDRLDALYDDALDELTWIVRAEGHDLNDLRDPDFIRMPLAAIMAGYVARNEGDAGEFEIATAEKDLVKYVTILSQPHVWFDKDQDLAEDEGEVVQLQWSAMGPNRFGTW